MTQSQTSEPAPSIDARLLHAEGGMRLKMTGSMRLGGSEIKYATKQDMLNAIRPALAAQGLLLRVEWNHSTTDEPETISVSVKDVAADKTERLAQLPVRLVSTNSKQDSALVTSYERYALSLAFNLAEGDGDAYDRRGFEQQARQAKPIEGRPLQPWQSEAREQLISHGIRHVTELRAYTKQVIGREALPAQFTRVEAAKIISQLSSRTEKPENGENQEEK